MAFLCRPENKTVAFRKGFKDGFAEGRRAALDAVAEISTRIARCLAPIESGS
jgi:hypothetical protein